MDMDFTSPSYSHWHPPEQRASASSGNAPSPHHRKRNRSASPDRVAKRPALLQSHPLSASHSPTPTPFESVGSAQMRRDGSTEFLQRTQRLGLRTPVEGRGGGNSPVEDAQPVMGWDVGMAVDVEMCDDMSRPVMPLRRHSSRSASSQPPVGHPAPHGYVSSVPHSHPLNRPHPAAFQQHLALSPRHTAGTFPIITALPHTPPTLIDPKSAPVAAAAGKTTRSPSPIVLSPPVSPRMQRRATSDSAVSVAASRDSPSTGSLPHHNGFGWTSSTSPGTRFSLGPRADCEKCRLKVPGHANHVH